MRVWFSSNGEMTQGGALKLISPLELLTKLKVFAEFPEAVIANFVFFT